MKTLVIVESPAKCSKLNSFLGSNYIVKASFGHLRDLPPKETGINTDNFEGKYVITKSKQAKELRDIAKSSNEVIIASDADREGEAIGWHLINILSLDVNKTKRIIFHEITKQAITNAIEHPKYINMNLVNSQQARRFLDRLVGFEISPILWKHVKTGLSAGRVQSVVLKIVIEKDEECKNFKGDIFWQIIGTFYDKTKKYTIKAELNKKFKEKKETGNFLKDCVKAQFKINEIKTVSKIRKPPAPFTTSSLLQECSNKFKMSSKEAMSIAQKLYESGHITYHRTDAVNLSNDAKKQIKEFVISKFGDKYYQSRNFKSAAKCSQEAHECIRPTKINNETIEMENRYKKVYELIWRRTVASQMSDAKLRDTIIHIEISNREEEFIAKAEEVVFEGYMKIYKSEEPEENTLKNTVDKFNHFKKEDKVFPKEIIGNEKVTNPPQHYTEATLIKKLKDSGIGRPSTYASIMGTLFDREYIVKETREGKKIILQKLILIDKNINENSEECQIGYEVNKIFPTEVGVITCNFLLSNFPRLMDTNFTVHMEEELDEIANGNQFWKNVLKGFYTSFHPTVEMLKNQDVESKAFKKEEINIGEYKGLALKARIGKYGPIIQIGDKDCSFVPLPKGYNIKEINKKKALEFIENSLPKVIGKYQDKDIILNKGKFGYYVKWNDKNVSLKNIKPEDNENIDVIIPLLNEEKKNNVIKEFTKTFKIINAKYGPCILYGKKFYKIIGDKKPEDITKEEAKTMIT